jgi:tape measure domain-containing protein
MSENSTQWDIFFASHGEPEIKAKLDQLHNSIEQIRKDEDQLAYVRRNTLQPLSQQALQTQNLNAQLKQSNETLAGGVSVLRTFGMAAGAALAAAAAGATAAAAALADLDGKAVKAFGERTATIRAYTTILGDAKQAQIEYSRANELASKTELTSASTLKAQQALIVAGFRGADLTNALTASMDVAATKAPEEREMTMERMGRAFSQILAAGQLRGQELNQLAEAGVNRGQVLELLGKGNAAAGEKAMSGGQVSAQQGIAAVQQAILQTLGTQKLGQFATGASGSLAGLLSNRDEALDILLKSFEGETLPAVKAYKAALTDQTNQLATSSETGKGLVMMLSDFASITTNVKAIWTDFSTGFLETFVSSYNAARENSGAFVAVTGGLRALGQTLGQVGGMVGTLANGFERMLGAISPIATWLSNFLSKTGEAMSNFLAVVGHMPEFVQGNFKAAFSLMGTAFKGETKGPKTLADYQAEDDEAEAAKMDALIKESAWVNFKKRQAAGFPAEVAPTGATATRWGKTGGEGGAGGRGGRGESGYDITSLMGGSGGGGSAPSFQSSIDAAAAVSSAPSAQMQAMSASAAGASSTGAPANVTVMPGAIVVSGVSDPTLAAQEVMRLLGQTLGRVHRAPSVRTGL